jgi:hypothetical protein
LLMKPPGKENILSLILQHVKLYCQEKLTRF